MEPLPIILKRSRSNLLYHGCAYSRRGDIKKVRGDLSGAISDYQFAVKYAQLPEDKEKLKKAQAEAKNGAEEGCCDTTEHPSCAKRTIF
jgi:hypothetical protein